jgi:hypothetical protein
MLLRGAREGGLLVDDAPPWEALPKSLIAKQPACYSAAFIQNDP